MVTALTENHDGEQRHSNDCRTNNGKMSVYVSGKRTADVSFFAM